jgi:hypothetical protein
VTGTAAAAEIAGHGLRVRLPPRWEARLYVRTYTAAGPGAAAYGSVEESRNPVLHAANFALPPGRGDFGTGAVERMAADGAFVALLEYDRSEAGRPLFAAPGVSRLASRDFAANALQRRLPGQLGCQRFFTKRGRAFCLYAVLGSRRHVERLVDEVNLLVGGLVVAAP